MRCPHDRRSGYFYKKPDILCKIVLSIFQLLAIFTASFGLAHVILGRKTFPAFIFFIISSGSLYTFHKLEKEIES